MEAKRNVRRKMKTYDVDYLRCKIVTLLKFKSVLRKCWTSWIFRIIIKENYVNVRFAGTFLNWVYSWVRSKSKNKYFSLVNVFSPIELLRLNKGLIWISNLIFINLLLISSVDQISQRLNDFFFTFCHFSIPKVHRTTVCKYTPDSSWEYTNSCSIKCTHSIIKDE